MTCGSVIKLMHVGTGFRSEPEPPPLNPTVSALHTDMAPRITWICMLTIECTYDRLHSHDIKWGSGSTQQSGHTLLLS